MNGKSSHFYLNILRKQNFDSKEYSDLKEFRWLYLVVYFEKVGDWSWIQELLQVGGLKLDLTTIAGGGLGFVSAATCRGFVYVGVVEEDGLEDISFNYGLYHHICDNALASAAHACLQGRPITFENLQLQV
ncbi:sulfite reductase [Sesbania bispinosa]|nr:sulfite reductase [Sesbania bispinosa]